MLNMLKPLDSCLYLTLSGHTRNLATNERLGSSVMDRLLDLLVASERPDHRKLTCNCLCSFGLRGQVGLWSHSKSSKSIFSKCHIMSRAPGKATRARPTTWFGISGGATRAKFCPHSASPRERDCQRITTSRLSQEVKICLSKINFRFWTLDLSHIGTIFRRDLLCDKRLPAQISEKKTVGKLSLRVSCSFQHSHGRMPAGIRRACLHIWPHKTLLQYMNCCSTSLLQWDDIFAPISFFTITKVANRFVALFPL